MNSKQLSSAEKKLKKNKSTLKNEGQQVFVLPPNLLQKLGINLGNMGNNPISPDLNCKLSNCATDIKHETLNKQHDINRDITNTEPVIVETVNSNNGTENLIVGTNSLNGGYMEIQNPETSNTSENWKKTFNEKLNSSIVMVEHEIELKNQIKLVEKDSVSASNVDLSIKTDNSQIHQYQTTENSVMYNEKKKIINIISEETITVEKLNELKVLQMPQNNVMIPASLNTIIVKKNSKPQSHSLFTSDNADHIEYNESSETLSNKNIGMDSKSYHVTQNFHFSNTNEDFDTNKKVLENKETVHSKQTEINESLDNNDKELLLSNTILDDQIFEASNSSGPCQNVIDIIYQVRQSTFTEGNLTEKEKSSDPTNNCHLKQLIYNNNSLLNNYTNDVNEVNDTILETATIDEIAQNIECFLPDGNNTNNNNNCEHSKSDVDQSKMLLVRDTFYIDSNQKKIIETLESTKSKEDIHETFNSEFMDTSVESNFIMDDQENYSIQQQSLKDNVIPVKEDSKSVTNHCFSGSTKNEEMNKIDLPLNPKRNNLMSKLCIQGVEKPGGENITLEQNITCLKTYLNKKKSKIHDKCLFTKETICNEKFVHNYNIDINESNKMKASYCQQYCKCSDYGILTFNLLDANYEHIHFTNRTLLDCTPAVVFSIYDDSYVINIQETTENLEHIEDNTEKIDSEYLSDFICWNNADSLQNEFGSRFENSQKQEKVNQNFQMTELIVKDSIKTTTTKDLNVDSQHDQANKPHINILLDTTSMNDSPEADDSNNLGNDKNYSDKLDLQNTSKKRKMSNNCNEGPEDKKVKKNLNLNENDIIIKDNLSNVAKNVQEVKCAVCAIKMMNTEWSTHIAKAHDYIAWKEGESPVDLEDDDAIRDHLQHIVQALGQLECSRCGLARKYAKSFLHHIKNCYNSSDTNDDKPPPYLSKTPEVVKVMNCDHCGLKCKNDKEYATHLKRCFRKSGLGIQNCNENIKRVKSVTCGVCKEEMTSEDWITHIQREHSYQAWQEGEKPLKVEDEEAVRKHLYKILQEYGPLICSKCGKSRKYAKLFQQHIESCTGPEELDSTVDTSYAAFESILEESLDDTGTELVKCGVCKMQMESKQWFDHAQKDHNYLSWQEGKTPLNICDKEAVRRYLYVVVQKLGALVCAKCGISRKYVKNYLSHVETCKTPGEQEDDTVKCGVCQKVIKEVNWISHISMNHEYIAWREAETSIDVSSSEAIWQHLLNIIKDIGALKCADCGKICKHPKTYLLHVKDCYGKTYVSIDDEYSTINDSVSDVDMSCTDDQSSFVSRIVKCGVCEKKIEERLWIDHIYEQHNYLAWQDGDKPLDLENKELIKAHLRSIVEKIGQLTCVKCGVHRRNAMPFYNHIQTCDASAESLDKTTKPKLEISNSEKMVKCMICQSEMSDLSWIEHISQKHDYMAWRDGDTPVKLDDEISVKDHLYKVLQTVGELVCSKCGQTRKYVKSYQQHFRGCTGSTDSADGTVVEPSLNEESMVVVKCALCKREVNESMWMNHIAKKHNYVSWKQNDPPLVFEDETSLRDHLYNIVQSIGCLVCSKCGLVRKYAKAYLQHIEMCQNVTWRSINKISMKMKNEKGDSVRCAVCGVQVDNTEWVEHIASQHNYLAWRDGDIPIDVDDEDEVRNHLKNIIQEEGYLKCSKCNVHRKYVRPYLLHLNTCDGTGDENVEKSEEETELPLNGTSEADDEDGSKVVTCGVCEQEVTKADWLKHIQKEHQYLAWEVGKTPIDLSDKEAVYNHLYAISVKCKGLTCSSCGLVRKYVKSYLHHVQECSERNYVDSNEILECGVCAQKIVGNMWRSHAMDMHYNVAWIVGDIPIDVRNFLSVDKYLKEYHDYKHKLVCNICGLSRASLAGFYAHILVCGKTDEEVDSWKDLCEICNQKYLCIYKTQHYWTHRVQEMAKERKIKEKQKKEQFEKEDVNLTPGRRKAAQKARSVIGDYATKLASDIIKCKSCNFQSDNKEEIASHCCSKYFGCSNDDSDGSGSVKFDNYSEDESDDTDVDSELSNEEEGSTATTGAKKKYKSEVTGAKQATKTAKFPYIVKDVKSYLQESKSDYFKMYYTRETLFTQWRDCTYEVVSDECIPQYMPQLEESCKVSISDDSWTTYKRFESRKEKGCKVLFTGACIQCIAWAPEHPDSTPASPCVLAVACHRGPDCPRLQCSETLSHPALIQLWDFQNFKGVPKLAFGLAHDYGTVWAMDWCPSGARDIAGSANSDNKSHPRLGLLALACSNGCAYVVSIPYLDENLTSDITFYKIKPCVELRLTRGNIKYQATSLNWLLVKGYTTISVGYGDGTVALYDLVTESPLLTAKEGGINILYPFQDERVHNACVTGLASCMLGAWCSSSPTGTTARAGGPARPLRAHSALAASAAVFMPHWPNVLLSGDDTIVGLSPSELEWGYVGRRIGSTRAMAPCLHRARIATVVPPLLQVIHPHPASLHGQKAIYKKIVAMLEMSPLAKKRSKHSNDELSMKVEPITYEDAIMAYGIEFKFQRDFDKALMQRMQAKQRAPFPERFPLGDVPALAYCPAAAHYTKLALATHSGLLFLIDV